MICDVAGLGLVVVGSGVPVWVLTYFEILDEPWIAAFHRRAHSRRSDALHVVHKQGGAGF
jgi:hypothetical protein